MLLNVSDITWVLFPLGPDKTQIEILYSYLYQFSVLTLEERRRSTNFLSNKNFPNGVYTEDKRVKRKRGTCPKFGIKWRFLDGIFQIVLRSFSLFLKTYLTDQIYTGYDAFF